MLITWGSVFQKLGDLTKARECVVRALSILTVAYGTEHPYTILVRDNLAVLDSEIC